MHTIVIARYEEDLGWIAGIPGDFEIFVYNKGDRIADPAVLAKAHHVIDRPNAGRESETYLHHMLSHRRADDDFTVFTQGNPFEHSPDFLGLLEDRRNWSDLQALACQWRRQENIPPALVQQAYRHAHASLPAPAGAGGVRLERFSLYTWAPLEFIDMGALRTSVDYREGHRGLPDGTNVASHFLDLCGLHDLAGEAARHVMGVFCYGAIFAVRNHRILRLSDSSLRTMQHLSKGAAYYGYVLERLWLHCFGAKFMVPQFPVIEIKPADADPHHA